jgi:hypothetical protein
MVEDKIAKYRAQAASLLGWLMGCHTFNDKTGYSKGLWLVGIAATGTFGSFSLEAGRILGCWQ